MPAPANTPSAITGIMGITGTINTRITSATATAQHIGCRPITTMSATTVITLLSTIRKRTTPMLTRRAITASIISPDTDRITMPPRTTRTVGITRQAIGIPAIEAWNRVWIN